MTLEFAVNDWYSGDQEQDEVRHTLATVRIVVGDQVATRIEDDWSMSVRESVLLSAYPLALWFDSSWWRLRWEPNRGKKCDLDWRMSHDMSSAGYGYIWPRLTFESDGEGVEVTCRRSDKTSIEPIRYLESFTRTIIGNEFENAIDNFIGLVVLRLDAVGVAETELQTIWREVREERNDPSATAVRRLEASLGFDPDEAPEYTLERFMTLSKSLGHVVLSEIAPACGGDGVDSTLDQLIAALAESKVPTARIQVPVGFNAAHTTMYAPWERGLQLAQNAREKWGLAGEMVRDKVLSDILDIDDQQLQQKPATQFPIGLAVRDGDAGGLKFHFHKWNHHGRRFEAARFLADYLLAPNTDRWLLVTDTSTIRQKIQRAFASEFLFPISELTANLNGNYSDDSIADASECFDVSEVVVKHQLANNHLVRWADTV